MVVQKSSENVQKCQPVDFGECWWLLVVEEVSLVVPPPPPLPLPLPPFPVLTFPFPVLTFPLRLFVLPFKRDFRRFATFIKLWALISSTDDFLSFLSQHL